MQSIDVSVDSIHCPVPSSPPSSGPYRAGRHALPRLPRGGPGLLHGRQPAQRRGDHRRHDADDGARGHPVGLELQPPGSAPNLLTSISRVPSTRRPRPCTMSPPLTPPLCINDVRFLHAHADILPLNAPGKRQHQRASSCADAVFPGNRQERDPPATFTPTKPPLICPTTCLIQVKALWCLARKNPTSFWCSR